MLLYNWFGSSHSRVMRLDLSSFCRSEVLILLSLVTLAWVRRLIGRGRKRPIDNVGFPPEKGQLHSRSAELVFIITLHTNYWIQDNFLKFFLCPSGDGASWDWRRLSRVSLKWTIIIISDRGFQNWERWSITILYQFLIVVMPRSCESRLQILIQNTNREFRPIFQSAF